MLETSAFRAKVSSSSVKTWGKKDVSLENCHGNNHSFFSTYAWREELKPPAIIRKLYIISVYFVLNIDSLATLSVFLLILSRDKHADPRLHNMTCDMWLPNEKKGSNMMHQQKLENTFKKGKLLSSWRNVMRPRTKHWHYWVFSLERPLNLSSAIWKTQAQKKEKKKKIWFFKIILSLFFFLLKRWEQQGATKGSPNSKTLVSVHMKVSILLQGKLHRPLLF